MGCDHFLVMKIISNLCLALCGFLPLAADAIDVLGKKPAHVWGGPSSVVNEQAITKMIWAPGIDDGYVPQGVTWAEGTLYLSAYQSTDPKTDRGPCRIYKVDTQSGATLGQFDLPTDCGHAGGLVYVGSGTLIAADTRRLYRIDTSAAFAQAVTAKAVTATLTLRGDVKGSFAAFDGSALFVGTFAKDADKARGHFLPLSLFDVHNGDTIDESAAIRTMVLPAEAQGAAFDKAGNLWLTASSSRFGTLYKLNGKTGQILSSFAMVIGVEDLGFDDDGQLWSVSEAGALRWQRWNKTFPLMFRFDPDKLTQQH